MAYYRAAQTAEDSRGKRQQILDAAYEVFSRKGYHEATVDEIIALADTGKGTVYNYFTNKEQLFYTLIRERSQPFEAALEQMTASDLTVLDKIENFVRLSLRFYKGNADLWRVMMHEIRGFGSEGHSCLKPEMRERYRAGFRRIIGMLEDVLSQAISEGLVRECEVTKVAYSLFSVMVMMVYQKFVTDDIDTTAHDITNIFLHGIAQR